MTFFFNRIYAVYKSITIYNDILIIYCILYYIYILLRSIDESYE